MGSGSSVGRTAASLSQRSPSNAANYLARRRALGRYHETVRDLGCTPGEATRMVERLLGGAGAALLANY